MQKKQPTHNFMATFQEGIVSQLDPTTHRIKATIPALEDFETAWLPYLVPNAGGNQFYCLPDVGELVAIVLDARGESGWVLGSIYNEQDPVPVESGEVWLKKFSNGTLIQHDRRTGNVEIQTRGTVTVTASGVVIHGDVQVNGVLNVSEAITSSTEVSAPSVKQGTVSLGSHVHTGVESGNKVSGAPK